MFPIRCFTCQKVIRITRDQAAVAYQQHDDDKLAALLSLGYRRECCRKMITESTDTYGIREMYDEANAIKPPDFFDGVICSADVSVHKVQIRTRKSAK